MMNIEDVRDYCLSLPCTSEDMPFGEGYVTYRIGGKIYCGLALRPGECLVQMKCSPDEFDELLERYVWLSQAWHWHKRHWVQFVAGDTEIGRDDAELLIRRAYALVAERLPKKTRIELGL